MTTALALPPARPGAGLVASRRSLARNSKSFALAGKLLPQTCRDDAAVVYAYCRRVDDVVDDAADVPGAAAAVGRLETELAALYAGAPQEDVVLAAFQEVVFRRRIPLLYPRELVTGMAMDAVDLPIVYESAAQLDLYCYRVAGTVGLMMCHVMGIRDEGRLRNAAHLGMAMQLTNICRDVAEDWARGRLYVPHELVPAARAELAPRPGARLPRELVPAFAGALPLLLDRAEVLYRSGDAGLPALSLRCAVAIRTARLVYSDIGRALADRGFDPTAGRAFVSTRRKLTLALRALVGVSGQRLLSRARTVGATPPFVIPNTELRYADDVRLP